MVTRRHSCFVKKVPAVNLLGSDIKIQKLFFCLWTFQHFLSKLDWFTAISPTFHFPHSWISQTFFCCLFYIFLRILYTGKCSNHDWLSWHRTQVCQNISSQHNVCLPMFVELQSRLFPIDNQMGSQVCKWAKEPSIK